MDPPQPPQGNNQDIVQAIMAAANLVNPYGRQTIPQPQFDHVASGCEWAGDSYGSNRNASMSAGVVWIAGRPYSVNAVSAKQLSASVDTYIDAPATSSGTIANSDLVYQTVSNNGAAPSLAAGSVRLAIIVTGASNIANAGSVNQGQVDKVLPIRSSIPMTFTDELGNIICPRDPNRRMIGLRRITGNASSSGTSATQITGLTVPIKPKIGKKIQAKLFAAQVSNAVAGNGAYIEIWLGTVGSGTKLGDGTMTSPGNGYAEQVTAEAVFDATGDVTLNGAVKADSSTTTVSAGSTKPAFLAVYQD